MAPFFDPEARRIQINLRLRYGTFTDQERRDIVSALEGIPFGEIRIDEAIVYNLGIGGVPGGIPITIDVWLHIGEGAQATAYWMRAGTPAYGPHHYLSRLAVDVDRQ
jgi:hypothetical protein